MEFVNRSFEANLNYDKAEWNLIIQMEGTGAAIRSTQIPEFVPVYEGGKLKKLPLAFLTFEWVYTILNSEGKDILKYTAADRYQFNPFDYNNEDVKKVTAISFDKISDDFGGRQIEGGYLDEIPQPSLSEFENWHRGILQFLNEKTQ